MKKANRGRISFFALFHSTISEDEQRIAEERKRAVEFKATQTQAVGLQAMQYWGFIRLNKEQTLGW